MMRLGWRSIARRVSRERHMTQHATPDRAPNTADLFNIMRTTRSMRRLKPDPVPNELIRKILKAGVCAPSGGNMQRRRFLVIRDPKVKETVGALYKRAWDEQVGPRYRSGEPAPGMIRERFLRLLDAAEYRATRRARNIDRVLQATRDPMSDTEVPSETMKPPSEA